MYGEEREFQQESHGYNNPHVHVLIYIMYIILDTSNKQVSTLHHMTYLYFNPLYLTFLSNYRTFLFSCCRWQVS
jgi:hypothetical protein